MRALRKDAAALQVAVARLEADLGDARAAAHVEARERARVAREGEERLVADARAADRLQRVQQGALFRHLADSGVGDAAARVQEEGSELRAAGGDGDAIIKAKALCSMIRRVVVACVVARRPHQSKSALRRVAKHVVGGVDDRAAGQSRGAIRSGSILGVLG